MFLYVVRAYVIDPSSSKLYFWFTNYQNLLEILFHVSLFLDYKGGFLTINNQLFKFNPPKAT